MTLKDALAGINAYPIPTNVLEAVAIKRGLTLTSSVTQAMLAETSYKLAQADLYAWLADAPNVSQGGQSYTIDATSRARFRRLANGIYGELGDDASGTANNYGYKGDRL